MDKAHSKILRGTEGVGTVTPQMIEERAHEIAQGEGRAEANDLDRTRAREDLTEGSEEAPTSEEPDRDWYTPRGSSGEKTPTVRPKDQENIPEKLIREGVEEADHDQRSRSE
jgi:general stress protein YciG